MAFHWLICDSLLLSGSCRVSPTAGSLQALHCRAGVLWLQPAGAALVAVLRRSMAVGGHMQSAGSGARAQSLRCTGSVALWPLGP